MHKPHSPSNQLSSRVTAARCAWVCACMLAFACGDDQRPALVSDDFGNEGKTKDGGQAPGKDPASSQDAGTHVISSGGTDLCTYDEADIFLIDMPVQPQVLGSAATRDGFGLVFARADGALFIDAIGKQGAAQPPVAVTTASLRAEAPMLFADSKQFLLAYRTSRSLVVRDLLHPEAPTTTLTSKLAVAADGGEVWALASGASGFTATWLEGDEAEPTLRGRTLDAAGAVKGDLETLPSRAGRKASQLALARMQDGSLVLAWKQLDTDKEPAVFGQRVSSELDALGEVTALSTTPVAAGRFGFQARRNSAGLLYPALDGGARKALKLRRIDQTGQPDGPVLNVANAPRVVQDGSITPFGRGYALVYRELPSTHTQLAVIRLAFINPFGDVVYDAQLAETSDTSAATSVSAEEGEKIIVSYIDQTPEGARVRAIRMACTGALILCGGNLE